MKEATGELNMTVITVVAIAAVAAFFYAFVWPAIQSSIKNNTCKSMGEGYKYDSSQKMCCDANGANCVNPDDAN